MPDTLEISRRRRRIVFAFVGAAHVAINASFLVLHQQHDWGMEGALGGAALGQMVLLGLWSALSDVSWRFRLFGYVGAMAWFCWQVIDWQATGFDRIDNEFFIAYWLIPAVCLALVGYVLRAFGVRVRNLDRPAASSVGRTQYSLRDALALIALAAIVARGLVALSADLPTFDDDYIGLYLAVMAFWSIVMIFISLDVLWGCLSQQGLKRRLLSIPMLLVIPALGLILDSPSTWDEAKGPVANTLGFLATLTLTFLALRFCGYRLVRANRQPAVATLH